MSVIEEEPTREVFGIISQKQPTPVTCVQTCLAMALGVPVEEVIAVFGAEPMNQLLLTAALSRCDFIWNQFINGTMVHQGWYFAAVPSLNRRGGMHQVLIRYTQDDGVTVLDPARENAYAQDGSDLKSWCDLTAFWPGGRIPQP